MSTRLHNAATWPRSVRQHIEAIAATIMLGLQVFREPAMNLGGSLAAITSSDAKDDKIRSLEVELVAAVLDGYSRKTLHISVFTKAPTTVAMLNLLKATMKQHGKPRFIVCDHCGQFKDRFRKSVMDLGISLVQSRPHHP